MTQPAQQPARQPERHPANRKRLGSSKRQPATDVTKLPLSYVSYDLETTGLGEDAHIIEIGAVRVIDGAEDEKFATFVALPPHAAIEDEARRVNGITSAMLAGAPTMDAAFFSFAEFVGDFPLVGQNISGFDNYFIDREARRLGAAPLTQNGWYDTMLLYRELVGKPANLGAICAHYGIDNDQAHRALGDAVATSDAYLAIIHDVSARRHALRRNLANAEVEPVAHELDGQLIVFTGNSYDFSKRDCELLALEHGARVRDSVIKRVTMVVDLGSDRPSAHQRNGEKNLTSKARRAFDLGIPILSGERFLALIGLTQEDLRLG